MTIKEVKRSKKTPWFKKGDRVVWIGDQNADPERIWHGTVKETFRKIGSQLYTLVWVNWDKDPGARDLIKMDWLDPEPTLDTLAQLADYKVGQKVKLTKRTKVNVGNGRTCVAEAGTVGHIISTNRRKRKQPAFAVSFDFLPEDRCLVLFRYEMAPAE